LTSALDGGEWSASRPGRFTRKESAPGTHWRGVWVGSRAVLDTMAKRKIPSPRRESNPRTPIVQPVAQRYTDWAITALVLFDKNIENFFIKGCQELNEAVIPIKSRGKGEKSDENKGKKPEQEAE
jgi:hypothetical protein